MGRRLFPAPTVAEENGGWVILYPFLQHVQSLIVDDDVIGAPSLETIEAVLVAADTALSKHVETDAHADNIPSSAITPENATEFVREIDEAHKRTACSKLHFGA